MNGTDLPSPREPNTAADDAQSTTVVIPTYNGARRVGLVLRALLLQDALPTSFEVIVVDNNSNDGTFDIVEHNESTHSLRERGTT
jgi:glycosyltransferase involved in cell wall biosynthesis